MSTLPTVLFRQLARLARTAQLEGVPLTGCVGLPQLHYVLCPGSLLKQLFRDADGGDAAGGGGGSSSTNDAFQALRMLPRQLAVLQASEEETREALAQWSALQQQWCTRGLQQLPALQQLEAAEDAAWLLQRLVTQQLALQMLSGADVQELQHQSEDAIKAGQQRLDQLAAAARAGDPAAFAEPAAGAGTAEHRLRQLEALSDVVFKQARLRNAPFEWVYDGLAPALLPQVLARGKGMPLTLALAAGGVARRLGMQVQLLCAPEQAQASIESGPLLLQQLPAEVAARQTGRTTASAPAADTWLLRLLPPPARGGGDGAAAAASEQWAAGDAVILDPSQNGKLLDSAAAAARYAHLQQHEGQQPVVAVWASLARTMVTAHQRRGESDSVAHWLYQLLALDTQAVEWGHVLQ